MDTKPTISNIKRWNGDTIAYTCDWEHCEGKHPGPENYCSMQRRAAHDAKTEVWEV
jgi:hypothetical protein